MSNGLSLVVDGFIFQHQKRGGVSRVFSEILPRICDLDPRTNIKVVVSGKVMHPLPKHERISHVRLASLDDYLWPGRLWWPIENFQRELAFLPIGNNSKRKIWHSTYYTRSAVWRGPRVVTVHDLIHERFRQFYPGFRWEMVRNRMRKCVCEADLVICVSESTSNDLQQVYGTSPNKITVIPNGYSATLAKKGCKPTRLNLERPFLLNVGGRFAHPTFAYKNTSTLLESFRTWHRRDEFDLVLVSGQWSKDELRILSEMGLSESVFLVSNVNDCELAWLYQQASMYIHPSLCEGMGIPVLEAIANGCPLVASRIPSTTEIAGSIPFYFEAEETEELHSALDQGAGLDRDCDRTRDGKKVASGFSWCRTAKETAASYQMLV